MASPQSGENDRFELVFSRLLLVHTLSFSLSLPPSSVADTVVVTSKHNDDEQYIWESNASELSIVPDPRWATLKRGTTVSFFLKEEAQEFLELGSLRKLVEKYSQFINFPIYLWESKVSRGWRVGYIMKLLLILFIHENSVCLSSTTNPKPKGQPSHCLLRRTA